jgi:hypothetical protein
MKKILFIMLILYSFFGCSSEKVIKDNPAFSDICENLSLYEGVKVSSDIVIIGWSAKECNFHKNAFTTGLSRSDWIANENGFCLYVTGGQPKGINFFELPTQGIKAKLTSIVRKNKDKAYLEFLDATIVN